MEFKKPIPQLCFHSSCNSGFETDPRNLKNEIMPEL